MKLVDLSKIEEFKLERIFNSYEDLINYYKQFNKKYFDDRNYYCEKHHIIARCEGGSNEKDNLVYLDLNHHAIAHDLKYRYYLSINDNKNAKKQICSAMRIIGSYNKHLGCIPIDVLTNGSQIKQDYIDFCNKSHMFEGYKYVTDGVKTMRIPSFEVENFLLNNKTFKLGRTFTSPHNKVWITNGIEKQYLFKEEAEKYLVNNKDWYYGMGKVKKHEYHNETGKALPTTLGKKWINKDGIRKNVLPEEINKYLNDGWIIGNGNSNTTLGKVRMNKNKINKFVLKEKINDYLNDGWTLGFYKK